MDYPDELVAHLIGALDLDDTSVVLDLGCGAGHLTLALATEVGSVIGVGRDAEPLRRAHHTATERGVHNVTWLAGTHTDLPMLGGLFGGRVAAITVSDLRELTDLPALVRDAGGLLVPGGALVLLEPPTTAQAQLGEAGLIVMRTGRLLIAHYGTAAAYSTSSTGRRSPKSTSRVLPVSSKPHRS